MQHATQPQTHSLRPVYKIEKRARALATTRARARARPRLDLTPRSELDRKGRNVREHERTLSWHITILPPNLQNPATPSESTLTAPRERAQDLISAASLSSLEPPRPECGNATIKQGFSYVDLQKRYIITDSLREEASHVSFKRHLSHSTFFTRCAASRDCGRFHERSAPKNLFRLTAHVDDSLYSDTQIRKRFFYVARDAASARARHGQITTRESVNAHRSSRTARASENLQPTNPKAAQNATEKKRQTTRRADETVSARVPTAPPSL